MWGNEHFAVARDNKMKRLLLAHDNSAIEFHRPNDRVDPQTRQFLNGIRGSRNPRQIDAIRSALSDGREWFNFLSLVTGPTGTGKTSVSLSVYIYITRILWVHEKVPELTKSESNSCDLLKVPMNLVDIDGMSSCTD
jgi:regulator of nonsense transcripts 1